MIEIPAGGAVNLGPGGRYFMLVGVKQPLKEGDSFLITLHFDKAGTENTAVKILGASATGMPAAASARRADTTASVSQR
jgi:periplasmic copper chaperone A